MKPKTIVLFLVFVLVFTWLFYVLKKERDLKKVLPKEIEVSKIISTHEKIGLGQGCGIIIYKISQHTIDQINQQGLNFFENSKVARGSESSEKQSPYYFYQDWRKTPIQENKNNKNFWSGLSCANQQNLNKSLFEKIIQEATAGNSYYTGHYEGQLVVIPSMQIAIFTYSG